MGRLTAASIGALKPEVLPALAERFKALGEPARLFILATLSDGELTVSELMHETGFRQSNLSRHLRVLHARGFVTRKRDQGFVYYGVADTMVLQICGLMLQLKT